MPETSIVIKATDRYSDVLKTLSKTTKAFSDDVDSLEEGLYALNKNKYTLKLDAKKAQQALKEAEKQFDLTHSAADGLKMELAQANYDNVVRNLNAVTKEARNTEKAISKLENRSGGGGGGGAANFGKSVVQALAISGITDSAKQLLSQGATTLAGSAFGNEGGMLFSNALSMATSGASAGFMVAGPAGALVGAGIGGLVGLGSGALQSYESQDSSFKSYVQDAVQEQLDAQSESLTSGSSIAAGRETDKISFATLFGSKETADSYLSNLVGMANSTPFLYDDLTSMSKTLATYGYDADSILPVLQTIGDAGAALGQSTSDMTAVATAIGRMKSSNKTTLEYLNILNDRGIGAVGMLSDAYGVDQGTMYSMISKGEVAGQDAVRIILDALSDSFAGAMEAQSKTFSGITSTIEGLQQELDNAMGEGYNQTRMQGLEAQKEWLAGDSGQEMQEAYTAIGAWKASLENAKEQYIRDAMNDAMGSEEYKTAEAEGDAAEMGRILMKAKIDGMNEYNANEGKDEELAQELSLIESVRDDAALNSAYWDAGYTLGQEFSKGRTAATNEAMVEEAWRLSGRTKGRHVTNWNARAIGIDYVPYDNFPALLHEGEKVLTAGEARQEKNGVSSIQIVMNGTVIREEADVQRVAQELLNKLEEANMRG
ncbi:MAG TPA: phage tail protein [Oscillibacter sp.]|nr:phage tail protein [Oscillibacter sp.]